MNHSAGSDNMDVVNPSINQDAGPSFCSGSNESHTGVVHPTLYLIPVGMSDAPYADVLPGGNLKIVRGLRYFIVENVRSARRFLKRYVPDIDISALTFCELNRHTDLNEVQAMLEPLRLGESIGVMSDAGCPAVADPGAIVVAVAQRDGYDVKPLVGPSSILMALMASGFNGQGFAFHGYLPISDSERVVALKRLESDSRHHDMTQIFIETPYRNDRLLSLLADTLAPQTLLCVACDITDPFRETIRTRTACQWKALMKQGMIESFDKRPAIFLIYAGVSEHVHQGKDKAMPLGARSPRYKKR